MRQVVVKSSTHVYGASETDPAWFREETPARAPVRTRVERSLIEVEALVRDFADDNPHLVVSRSCGSPTCWAPTSSPRSATTSASGCFPASPGSTRWSSSSRRTTSSGHSSTSPGNRIPGVFNVAGAGKLPWSEVASIGGAHLLPLPPFRPACLRRPRCAGSGLVQFPPEMEGLIRYGRGVDTSRLIETGLRLPVHQSPGRSRASPGPTTCAGPWAPARPEYRYEQDVEQFFRHSPAVVRGIDG